VGCLNSLGDAGCQPENRQISFAVRTSYRVFRNGYSKLTAGAGKIGSIVFYGAAGLGYIWQGNVLLSGQVKIIFQQEESARAVG